MAVIRGLWFWGFGYGFFRVIVLILFGFGSVASVLHVEVAFGVSSVFRFGGS